MTPVFTRARWLAAAGIVAALAASLIGAQAAAASVPSGTRLLASGASAYPEPLTPIGTTTNDLIYLSSAGVEAVPLAGGTPTLIGPGGDQAQVAGDMVFIQTPSGTKWYDVATSTHGSVKSSWTAPAPDGGLFLQTVSGNVHLRDQSAADGSVTDLGIVPETGLAGVFSTSTGAVVLSTDGAPQASYISYAHPGTVTAVNMTGVPSTTYLYCLSMSSNALGCTYTTNSGTDKIVRLSFDGGAPLITTAPTGVIDVAVTPTATAWRGAQVPQRLYSQAADGGAVSSRVPSDFDALAAGGANLYFDQNGPSGYGVYSAPDATGAATFVVGSQPAPLHAYQIAIAPGRVVWSDDSSTSHPVWSRSLSSSGGVTVGGSTLVASHATALGLSASAMRTAYAYSGSGIGTVHVVGGPTSATLTHVVTLDPVQLSGTRVVYLASTGGGHVAYLMKNLVTGTITNLTASLGLQHMPADYNQVSLWGNYLTYGKSDGSLWRKDVSTSAKPVRLQGPAKHTLFVETETFGDWVAWSRCTSSGCTDRYQNVRTNKSHALSNQASLAGASAAGVVTQIGGRYALQPWSGAAAHRLPGSVEFARYGLSVYQSTYTAPAIDGSRMAWIGGDGLPRVAPLGVKVSDRPQSLGNQSAPRTFRHGRTWHFDLPTSANLTSCAVDIRTSTGKLVRALPCASGAMKQGEVLASWDGTAHGKKVRDATYTWTVTASNGSGALLAGDGSRKATSGRVTVSG